MAWDPQMPCILGRQRLDTWNDMFLPLRQFMRKEDFLEEEAGLSWVWKSEWEGLKERGGHRGQIERGGTSLE